MPMILSTVMSFPDMKLLLLIIIGALLWNNNQARQFASDSLSTVSEFIAPDDNTNKPYEPVWPVPN